MNRPFNSFDRFILFVDRAFMIIGLLTFLWVQVLQKDFYVLLIGLAACVGLFFTSRYMIINFKEDEVD